MRIFLIIISSVLAVLVALTALIWLLSFYGLIAGDFPEVDDSKLQAVFLTNNQVYFGELEDANRGYAKLTNVYYLRLAENLQQGSNGESQSLNLVKLGGELHGPEDAMFIPKDKIQFWENLSPSSRVVKAIQGQAK